MDLMTTYLTIPAGGMYQEWMSLIDLVEEDSVRKLNEIAVKECGVRFSPRRL